MIGELASWNTIGAVAGSLGAGFVLLPWLGLWSSLRLAALLYLLASAAVLRAARWPLAGMLLPALGVVLVFSVLDPTRLPRVSLAPGEELRGLRESASGTVAVTQTDGVLALKLDGHYTVGASGAVANDRRQGELPMLLHPRPRSVFFLGLGTGISAGAALFQPVERVTVAELVPGVAELAREHFAPFINGLFTDPRVDIVIGDGRAVLQAGAQPYDVVVGDLFVPWHAGTGRLYTREPLRDHPRPPAGRRGIRPVAALLPALVARVRGHRAYDDRGVPPRHRVARRLLGQTPIVALVGYRTARPLDLDAVVANVRGRKEGANYPAARARALTLLFYAGNLSAARDLVARAPINTDDRPVIEYLAPATPVEVVAGQTEWLTGLALSRLWAQLAASVPPDDDPYLASVAAAEREDVHAGRSLHDAVILRAAGRDAEARAAFDAFSRRVPADVARAFAGLASSD